MNSMGEQVFTLASRPAWGWGAFLLPYLEQAPLYDQGRVGQGSQILDHRDEFQTALSEFMCPSDDGDVLNNDSNWNRLTENGWEAAKSNYVAANDHETRTQNSSATGAFYENSNTRMRSITDGTSNTIAVGERRYQPEDTGVSCAVWAGTISADATHGHGSFDRDLAGTGVRAINQIVPSSSTPPDDWNFSRAFSSHHPGGAQFVLFDGSVRFISETIEHSVGGSVPNSTFEYLIAIRDGQVVGEF